MLHFHKMEYQVHQGKSAKVYMIDWIYSVAGFWTGVTTLYQNFSQRTKTVLVTSNRFRVVSNIMCDDFMQFGKPLGPEQVPPRLAAPPGVSRTPAL